MKPRILSICSHKVLLHTRHALLARLGYEVVSADGFASGISYCEGKCDLIIMGHEIPHADKRLIISELRGNGCKAPIVSLMWLSDDPIPEADRTISPLSPEEMIDAIRSLLAKGKARSLLAIEGEPGTESPKQAR